MGDFAAASWNAQARLAADPEKQRLKRACVARLLQTRDFVLLQETHSTRGKMATWSGFRGARTFASHWTKMQAGVAVVVKDTFLNVSTLKQSGLK